MVTYTDYLKHPYLWRRASRSHPETGKAPISLRIEIEGFVTRTGALQRAELAVGVTATEAEWSQEAQRKTAPRAMSKAERALLDMDNDKLADWVKAVKLAYHNLKSQTGNPSPADLLAVLRSGHSKDRRDRSFAAALEMHRRDRAKPTSQRRASTIRHDREKVLWVLMYMAHTKQLDLPAESVDRVWLRGFERWADSRGQGPRGIRHSIHFACNAMQLAEDEGLIKTSRVQGYRYLTDLPVPQKRHLSAFDLERLAVFPFPPKLQPFADIFVFMAYTGLSYSDYHRFAQTPERFLKRVGDTLGIGMVRQKLATDAAPFWVPLLDHALRLWHEWRYAPPSFTLRYLNGRLKTVGEAAGLPLEGLSTKDARSTFSQYMRDKGLPAEIVAGMAGHDEATMNKHYSSVSPDRIVREILGMKLSDH
ncbi:hypothetical protein [Hymenobacter koreensis]